jgi:gamma-glutamylcyclotransferase (GGCT)/AIG2-like uncharacterized protein YtfP
MKEYLFVYGSLRSSRRVPAEIASLVDRFRRLGAAQVNGRLYDFGRYCGAVLDSNVNTVIHGELIELPEGDGVLEALDRYEEIDPTNTENSLFARNKARVVLTNGSEQEAWIYVYNSDTGAATLIPGGDYKQFDENKSSGLTTPPKKQYRR